MDPEKLTHKLWVDNNLLFQRSSCERPLIQTRRHIFSRPSKTFQAFYFFKPSYFYKGSYTQVIFSTASLLRVVCNVQYPITAMRPLCWLCPSTPNAGFRTIYAVFEASSLKPEMTASTASISAASTFPGFLPVFSSSSVITSMAGW